MFQIINIKERALNVYASMNICLYLYILQNQLHNAISYPQHIHRGHSNVAVVINA